METRFPKPLSQQTVACGLSSEAAATGWEKASQLSTKVAGHSQEPSQHIKSFLIVKDSPNTESYSVCTVGLF